mgnify:FL=1
MEKYESKQVQIFRPAADVYGIMSDFNNFSPLLNDMVEDWQADADSCSFTAKGFTVKLRIEERRPDELIKIVSDGGPFDFAFWIQMKEVGYADTRLRLVLHADLNMMMKMMVGGRIRDGLDQIAEKLAESFNAGPDMAAGYFNQGPVS